ncbi:MAG: fumarylacetoacetate hydrolase family protein [Candidatus Velthaea sp.]
MRLVTFSIGSDSARFGVETPAGVVDVHAGDPELPVSLHDYLRDLDNLRPRLEVLLAKPPERALIPRTRIRLHAPVSAPQKFLCIGLNYRDHAAEVGLDLPDQVTVFAKHANTLIGDGEAIEIPRESDKVDYEVELAFVIGKRGRHIAKADAYAHIAGYTIVNDVSVRDYQMRTSQWTMGKNFDTHGPCGPAIVTTDEIPDPHVLAIRCSIGGEMLQDSNTSQLVFDIPTLVAELSAVMTLEPGDIVATGTPAGVGTSRTPKRWMRPGEAVRLEIERIGALENPIVAARTA